MYGLIWVRFLNLWNALLSRTTWRSRPWHSEEGATAVDCTKLGKQNQKMPSRFQPLDGISKSSFYPDSTNFLL